MPRVAEPQRLRPLAPGRLHRQAWTVVTGDQHPLLLIVHRQDLPAGAVGHVLAVSVVGADEADPVAGVQPLTAAGLPVDELARRAGKLTGGQALGLAQTVQGVDGGVRGVGHDLHRVQAALQAVAVPGVHDLLNRRGGVRDQVHPVALVEVGERLVGVAVADPAGTPPGPADPAGEPRW